jgi:Family of unknown function (DUF6084)
MAAAGVAPAPELTFAIMDAGVLAHAAAPTLRFELGMAAPDAGVAIKSVALSVQIRIAATRRHYGEREQQRLFELFGRPEDWGRNLHGLHWTTLNLTVPAFTGSTVIDLPVACTYDLDVTASRYMNALEAGEVPLEFLFSGTVFYAAADGRLQVGRIGWDKEAGWRLPVAVWREMMDLHFPDSAWLRLRRESFDRLTDYRARNSLLSWEDAIDALLREAEE